LNYVRISEWVVRHIMKRHRDWVGMLKLDSEIGVRNFIMRVLSKPDEVHMDRVRNDVRYFLKRLDDKFLCIVVVGDDVVTAYLLNREKYGRYKVRRWG
jgi:hypothetical protein